VSLQSQTAFQGKISTFIGYFVNSELIVFMQLTVVYQCIQLKIQRLNINYFHIEAPD
jgi:hypothetical protein